MMRNRFPFAAVVLLAVLLLVLDSADDAWAQDVTIADIATLEGDTPYRLVGYGLVVGLDGTGDRSFGGSPGAAHTVRSIVNTLERFGIRVPPEQLRVRNVAAVMVTAEISAFARPGTRFDVHVSSIGDATSLDGGVLLMTPLLWDPSAPPVATAQGPLVLSRGPDRYAFRRSGGSAIIPAGGVLEASLPRLSFPDGMRLLLKQPDLRTAEQIRQAVVREFGDGRAMIEDQGSVLLVVPEGREPLEFAAEALALSVTTPWNARLLVDARTGTVVSGGDVTVGPATISHGGVTLVIGGASDPEFQSAPGAARLDVGATVQDVVAALHMAGARPADIAHILRSLASVGAIRAEVIVQ